MILGREGGMARGSLGGRVSLCVGREGGRVSLCNGREGENPTLKLKELRERIGSEYTSRN